MPELVLASRKPGALKLKKQTIFSIYLEVTVFNSVFAYLKTKADALLNQKISGAAQSFLRQSFRGKASKNQLTGKEGGATL